MNSFEQIVLAIIGYSIGCTALIIHLIYKLHKADQGIDKVIKNYIDQSITQDLEALYAKINRKGYVKTLNELI